MLQYTKYSAKNKNTIMYVFFIKLFVDTSPCDFLLQWSCHHFKRQLKTATFSNGKPVNSRVPTQVYVPTRTSRVSLNWWEKQFLVSYWSSDRTVKSSPLTAHREMSLGRRFQSTSRVLTMQLISLKLL